MSASLPLHLVSQVQRSGGSLILQLLDGHPEVFAHPSEIHIGRPKKWNWPALDLSATPESWFDRIHERPLERFIERGYAKAIRNEHALRDRRPFNLDVATLRSLFLAAVGGPPVPTQRVILDGYFSALFAAWRDYRPTGRERCVAGFLPILNVIPESVAGYWSDYPDGRMITLVRDPRPWWVSARAHLPDYEDLDAAIALWSTSAAASLALGTERPDRVLLATYERLVTRPEETMRRVADFLGIAFHPTLTMPTYLGQPVRPNSSFGVDGFGVGRHGLDRVGDLTAAELKRFPDAALVLYGKIEEAASRRLG